MKPVKSEYLNYLLTLLLVGLSLFAPLSGGRNMPAAEQNDKSKAGVSAISTLRTIPATASIVIPAN